MDPLLPRYARILRLSSVAFFNATPLVWGLDHDPGISLRFGVPSALLGDLRSGQADVALLPVIDYQRMPDLRLLRATGIGCDGPTLTVRLFSRSPIAGTRVLAVDGDSHTSVALAQIVLFKCFGLRPDVISLDQRSDQPGETLLLIGDKVVTDEPAGYPHQLDLGQAWKELTGLPFVFALWTARPDVELPDVDLNVLSERLIASLDAGLRHVEDLIVTHAVPRGWPAETARRYLTEHLKFTIGDPQVAAISLFHELAGELGLIETPVQKLRFA
ncbi:MAG: menaquinone biosynthesis protein [Burkholderiales bacterium]|nr:menaquinone biosynthesis protein [Phycisphaerae bacterium]